MPDTKRAGVTPEELRRADAFADQAEEDLAWLARKAERMALQPGEAPFAVGDPAEHLIVVLEGVMQIFSFESGQRHLFDTFRAGRVTGLLPYSRMTHFNGEGVVTEPSAFALIHKRHFPEMLHRMPEVGQRLVGLMSDRVRATARDQEQREKMMALGKLSAGLAHELNNPAAAVRRSAAALSERMDALPDLVARLARHGLSEEAVCAADAVRENAAPGTDGLSALERQEREDALADWLEDYDVPDAWLRAETFAEAGLAPDALDKATRHVPAEAVPDLVAWLEGSLAAEALLQEIDAAAARIADLVASVKTYTHMDEAPERAPVDLRRALESTLTMLGHKLKEKSIQVERDFPADLPPVPAYGGALNQVWTNLIDNAADAMADGGTLRLAARAEGPVAVVEVEDDGDGIPEEIQGRVFEPFFTTKDVGEGTGLGLDIAHRIVTRQHGGEIEVASEPGRTVFTVRLPLEA